MTSRRWHIFIVALLLLAIGLRGYNLRNRGIFDYDEAWYLLEAKSLYDTLQFAWKKTTGHLPADQHLKAYVKERGTVPITTFKPGHTLLLLLGLFAFGLHDYAGFFVSAIAGTLTVYLVYRLGTLMYGPYAGLLSGLILAVSPFHIGYSRSSYAQADSLFFITLGFFLWYRQYRSETHRIRPLFWSGTAIGYAFTCHFNIFIIPPLIVAYEVIAIRKRRDAFPTLLSGAKRLMALGAGMATPLVFFELPVRILHMLGKLPPSQLTYFEQYLYRGSLAGELHFSLDGTRAILEKFYLSEGLLILVPLVAVGIWICLQGRKNRFEDILLLSLLLVPALPWCLLSVGLPPLFRTFAILSLPLSLLVARGLLLAADYFSLHVSAIRRPAFAALCTLVLLNGILRVKDLLPIHSSYREATNRLLAYVNHRGGRIGFFPGSVWPIWYFYLSARYDTLSPAMQQRIQFYPDKGDAMPPEGDFDAFDIKRYARAYTLDNPEFLKYASQVRNTRQLVVQTLNPIANLPLVYAEVGGQNYKEVQQHALQTVSSNDIEIYDLRENNGHASRSSYVRQIPIDTSGLTHD